MLCKDQKGRTNLQSVEQNVENVRFMQEASLFLTQILCLFRCTPQ